ncbi:hypothetical protein ABL78_7553 [Leptomonas seymouri]|uniref:Uncharacterized protein n=1 Tax=Leptomonas seymouri TaxID=5684 RepID=A0A0N0P2V9_LEPSE|nr:hypothetical protein ABL78_7553 [Leptomonas seymouri]|eukprot:KPI83416.1 hypothetical protein ABL78_7553 [Leptomonas seymouri]
MGQSASSMDGYAGERQINSDATAAACPSLPEAEGASTCVEMVAMLRDPAPSTQPLDDQVASDTTVYATSADAVSVFCLDVSKGSLLQLRQVLETPVPHRAAAFHDMSKHSRGLLFHAPGSTSVRAVKSFLLGQAKVWRGSDISSAEAPSSLHLFALQDPAVVVDGADGPVVVTREVSADLLIPLTGSTELYTLSRDPTVLAFTSADAKAVADAPSSLQSSAVEGNWREAPQRDVSALKEGHTTAASSPASAAASPTTAPRTVVLLFTTDAYFGMDGGSMLLIGCCVALCTCIAASICCCMSSAKNKAQQQSNANNGKPDYNNNNSNYNNNQQNYNNGGNNAGGGYYGNPYAPAGYNNNNANYTPPANGYGVPPNAYGDYSNYQNPYQNPYQPPLQPQNNNDGYYNTGGPQPGAAPL